MKVIITGATGMVGEGILEACMENPEIESVLSISRRPCGVQHTKLTELIHDDFSDFSSVEDQLLGYDAAYLSMGVSSVGLKEDEYRRLTYDMTMALAKPLEKLNPQMTICYVTGMGTDSTERGRSMWARVKGKTENDLMKMKFKQAFMFRPGGMQPSPGAKHIKGAYKAFLWLMPLLRKLLPGSMHTIKELALAMFRVTREGNPNQVIEVPEIVSLAKQEQLKG